MRYSAMVIRGKGRGKKIGFPTINLRIPRGFDMPFGIYGGYAWLGGRKNRGAFHYGPIPTFYSSVPSLEVFVLDNAFSAVPPRISFELLAYIREIKKFSSPRELSCAIKTDVHRIEKIILPHRPGRAE